MKIDYTIIMKIDTQTDVCTAKVYRGNDSLGTFYTCRDEYPIDIWLKDIGEFIEAKYNAETKR